MLLERVEWLGHSGFRVSAGSGKSAATIYIDPYRIADDDPKADLVLITHQHYDHFSPQEPFHPREAGYVGYELSVRGERLYHAGDTDVIPEMDWVVGVDVALLPVSGIYVMTALEAAEAARRIQPAVAVPMHWGEHIGSHEDAQAFADAAPVDVVILQPGVAA
jgi:L-ascorbate metabolism protein UlaG (beta-lactamase superfamily)